MALNERALTLIEAQSLAEAEKALREALQADPFCGQAHSNLGVVLLQRRQVRDAACHLEWACSLLPRASQARANLGLLYEMVGRYDQAESQLRAALQIDPDDIEVIGYLARIHVRRGVITEETNNWLQRLAVAAEEPWRKWAALELSRRGDTGAQP